MLQPRVSDDYETFRRFSDSLQSRQLDDRGTFRQFAHPESTQHCNDALRINVGNDDIDVASAIVMANGNESRAALSAYGVLLGVGVGVSCPTATQGVG